MVVLVGHSSIAWRKGKLDEGLQPYPPLPNIDKQIARNSIPLNGNALLRDKLDKIVMDLRIHDNPIYEDCLTKHDSNIIIKNK